MKKIAIVYGGKSLEHDISIITSLFIMESLKKEKIAFVPLYFDKQNRLYSGKALQEKDNYEKKHKFKKASFVFKNGYYHLKVGSKYLDIESAVICCHGFGVEDGTIKALFNLMNIPSTSSSIVTSSLLQDKSLTKVAMKDLEIPIVKGVSVTKENLSQLNYDFTFPLIVKPNNLGSSIGVKKVSNNEQLLSELSKIFQYDNKAIIEQCVENLKELNVAILGNKNKYIHSDIELVNDKDDVLSFFDKYELFQKDRLHVIPARINKSIKDKIIKYASSVFENLSLSGVVRFDFLLNSKTNELYLNEINNIPGSLSFYLFKNKGYSLSDIVKRLVEISKEEYKEKRELITTYESSSLRRLRIKK